MCGEPLPELAQRVRIGRGLVGESVGTLADGDVIAEDQQRERMVRIAVSGIAGQQDLLLEPKCRRPCSPQ